MVEGMNMTRRDFVASLGAAMAVPMSIKADDWFIDIGVDKYYVLQGGQYGDTGGVGQPGYAEGPELVEYLHHLEHCRELEDSLEIIEKNGYYFTPSSYLTKPWREYDRIYLTKRWMLEFYRRHKNDTPDMWRSKYEAFLDIERKK